jgi:hypothetical protein
MRSGFDAGATIAARAPMFLAAGFNPVGAEAREVNAAIAEKATAAVDGAFSASAKIGELWFRAAFGALSANEAATAWLDVCDAALAPARQRVRANAKRLTGL